MKNNSKKMTMNNWNENRLNELLDQMIDYRGQSVPKTKTGIPLITARNVRAGYLDFSESEFIDENMWANWMKRGIPKAGDVIFTTEAPLGNVCIYPTFGQYALGQRTVALRTDATKVISNFLFYFLLSDYGQRIIDFRSTGSTAKGIKSSELKKIVIKYPISLSEQQRIVEVLETWDKYLNLLDRRIKIKRQNTKELTEKLIQQKVRVNKYCQNWTTHQLNNLGQTYPGLTGKNADDFGSGKRYISYMNVYKNLEVTNIENDLVKINETEKQNIVKYGDILFTTSSETPEEVGYSSAFLLKNNNEYYLNSFCFGYRLNNFNSLVPEFAKYLFRGTIFRKRMFRVAQGATRYNLSKRDFIKTTITIPENISEQKAIAMAIMDAETEIEVSKKKRKLILEQKKFLLNNLITGKIRLPEFRDKN